MDAATLQIIVIRAWRAAFTDTQLQADSDFYDLGGDSYTALRIADEVAAKLGLEAGDGELVASIFECPTPQEYASRVLELSAGS